MFDLQAPVGPVSITGSIAPQGFVRTDADSTAVRTNAFGYGDIYVSSVVGYNGNSGGSWRTAKATASGADAVDWPGCKVYFDSAHSETSAVGTQLMWNTSVNIPTQLLSVVRSAVEPPDTLAAGALIGVSGSNNLEVNGTLYAYGMTFKAGTAGGTASIKMQSQGSAAMQWYESCFFDLSGANANSLIQPNDNSAGGFYTLKNCTFKFGADGQRISNKNSRLNIVGGSIVSGSTAQASQGFIDCAADPARLGIVSVAGFDFSNLGSGGFLTNGFSITSPAEVIFADCKLPSGWTGTLLSGSGLGYPGFRARMENCDSTDTNYRLWWEGFFGSTKSETTIVRTGGATDGTTPLSWKMATSSYPSFPALTLVSPERAQWNELIGSAKTLTVEVVHDSRGSGTAGRLTDADAWLEVMYLGTSGFPLGSWISDAKANVFAAAADQTDSGTTWTTTGLSTPLKQSLSVTVTPQEKGHFIYRVVVAKPSITIYVDPLLTVT